MTLMIDDRTDNPGHYEKDVIASNIAQTNGFGRTVAPSPQRQQAHALISDDITRISKKAGLPFRTLTDLVNTNERYPELVPLLIDQYYLEPPLPEVNAYAAGNALRFLAVPSDYDDMATIAADRSLGSGRAAVLEWIIKQGLPDGLHLVVDQIDDPSVRALGIKYIRQYTPLPNGLRPTIERYLDDPDSEVRKQATATLKKLPT